MLVSGIIALSLGGTVALSAYVAYASTLRVERIYAVENGEFSVPPGHYTYSSFGVPSAYSDVRVTGTFVASGGTVEVYIMNEANFTSWQNSGIPNASYDSGNTYSGTIYASLSSGTTYYVVYDNHSSSNISNIQANITMHYKAQRIPLAPLASISSH